jgi:DNA repair protein RadC
LNGAHEVIGVHISTIGLLNNTVIHPREIFIHGIKDNAAAIVIAHTHPSGYHKPSSEDNEITARIKVASEIIGINFLDHLIISKRGYYSYRLESELFNPIS